MRDAFFFLPPGGSKVAALGQGHLRNPHGWWIRTSRGGVIGSYSAFDSRGWPARETAILSHRKEKKRSDTRLLFIAYRRDEYVCHAVCQPPFQVAHQTRCLTYLFLFFWAIAKQIQAKSHYPWTTFCTLDAFRLAVIQAPVPPGTNGGSPIKTNFHIPAAVDR